MYNDQYPPLQYHTVQFHWPKIPEFFLFFSPTLVTSPQKPLTFFLLFIYCVYSFAFTRMPYSWNHPVCNLFQIDILHLVICIVSNMSFHGLTAHFFLTLNTIPLSGLLKSKTSGPNGVAYGKFHVPKQRLNVSFSSPRNGILSPSISNCSISTSQVTV